MKRGFLLFSILVAFLLLFICSSQALAKKGVGVNVSKIFVNEPLVPGGVYKLPSVGVINTGDETCDYEATLSYVDGKKELKPGKEWVTFNPSHFKLAPKKVQNVRVKLTIPLRAEPGKYIALIEGHPKMSKGKNTQVAIAAATWLRFEVKQDSLMWALYYRIRDVMKLYAPWSYITIGVFAVVLLVVVARKRFKISLRVERRGSSEGDN